METYEKLGAFYLGKEFDPDQGKVTDDLLLYDSKDLTTHAVCVGMTGSGKTGLCISLLEEAAIDGVPALVIDPKGDIGNMLLTFPELRAEDFRPWIDEQAAARKEMTPDEYAANRAKLWKDGLASWGQDGERIRRLRESVDLSIYTPGSSAGLQLRVLRAFTAPPAAVIDDSDAMRERVASTVAGVLGLLGIDADPVRSQEHVLLSTILDRAWRAGRDLDFAALIGEIQSPPFDKIGVLDLDAVIPDKKRFELAMAVNTLLASPTFSAWTRGEPMDIGRLLYTADGQPRVSILSISHLSESERMFFVTLLLNEVVSWMRSQSGTTSLRGLLYMDEVFGFFPPVAEPPSKRPMLTLLKQARAYGMGVVLATQNPVDLDYKGLSNAGTWFLGRLQTERDLRRVLDGLEGATSAAGGTFDRSEIERLLAGLKSRVFLMNNVHDDGPTLFHTRWAMSYLRGPMTRDHIRTLMADRAKNCVSESSDGSAAQRPTAGGRGGQSKVSSSRPPIPSGIEQRYMPMDRVPGEGEQVVYRPKILGSGPLHYVRVAAKIDHWQDVSLLADVPVDEAPDIWAGAPKVDISPDDLQEEPDDGIGYAGFPAWAVNTKQETVWQRSLKNTLYREHAEPIWHCKKLKVYSELGESKSDFLVRVRQLMREHRDEMVEKLRSKYTPKLDTLDERIRKAQQRVEVERSQWRAAGADSAVSFGASILGALFGRRKKSLSTAARKASRAIQQRGDIGRAKDNVKALIRQREELEQRFERDIEDIRMQDEIPEIDEIIIRPRKGDISPRPITLVWCAVSSE
ncbi:MAG TPA: ATP-binding protein [Phycisphaerales bacterium]|nr:ATP-binding protein [Phycisphaerales bacterium]